MRSCCAATREKIFLSIKHNVAHSSLDTSPLVCKNYFKYFATKNLRKGRYQRWSREHKAQGQGQGHKKISRPWLRTDLLEAKDRGHRRKCSPKKKVFKKIFKAISKKSSSKIFFQAKKVFKNFFSDDFHLRKTKKGLCKFSARFLALSIKISTVQKIVLSSSRGHGNFRALEASRPRTSNCVLEAKDVLEGSTSGRY